MVTSSRAVIAGAERRFPVRLCLAVPPGGFGPWIDRMHAWLDADCGADGWMIAPSGLHEIANDTVVLYFLILLPLLPASRAGASGLCRKSPRGLS